MKAQSIAGLLLTVMWLSSAGVFAQTKTSQQSGKQQSGSQSQPGSSDKLDVTDLENKYWAPKDTDFSVVQNRTYTKEHKVFLSLGFGPDLSQNAYLAGNQISVNGNYFFNERYGIQATYLNSYLHGSRALGDIQGLQGSPDYGIMKSYEGVGFDWVPFYSKMSFLGQKILYFDMALTPTLGMTQYDQQSIMGSHGQQAFTYGIDLTQYYFFSDHFAFRVDLKNQWYNENVLQYTTGQQLRTQNDREMIFLVGFTFYFGGK